MIDFLKPIAISVITAAIIGPFSYWHGIRSERRKKRKAFQATMRQTLARVKTSTDPAATHLSTRDDVVSKCAEILGEIADAERVQFDTAASSYYYAKDQHMSDLGDRMLAGIFNHAKPPLPKPMKERMLDALSTLIDCAR